MDQFVAALMERLEREWGSWRGLIWVAILCLLIGFHVGDSVRSQTAIAALVFLACVVPWSNSRWEWWGAWRKRPLRMVIGVYCDDRAVEREIEEDFSRELRKLISTGNLASSVRLIRPTKIECEGLESDADYQDLMTRKRAQMLVCGRVRKRLEGGNYALYLDFRACVRHAAIEDARRAEFVKEISSVFPSGILKIPASEQLPQLKITAEWIAVSARYILSLAAGVSGDLASAERMLADAISLVPRLSNDVKKRTRLEDRLNSRLRELRIAQANRCFNDWRESRDPAVAQRMKVLIEQAISAGEKGVQAKHMLAVTNFILDGDPVSAERSLRAAAFDNSAHFTSLAFACAMQGKFPLARKCYRDAWKRTGAENVIEQILSFFEWSKARHPNLYSQILWCESIVVFRVEGRSTKYKKICDYLLKDVHIPEDEKVLIRKSLAD